MAEIVVMEQKAQVELAAVSLAERFVVTPHLEVAQVAVAVIHLAWLELIDYVSLSQDFSFFLLTQQLCLHQRSPLNELSISQLALPDFSGEWLSPFGSFA